MTLRQFLSVLSTNKGTQVTLLNIEDVELLTFNVEGYESLESDILDRGVKKVFMSKTPTAVSLKITLLDAVTTPETPDNTGTNG